MLFAIGNYEYKQKNPYSMAYTKYNMNLANENKIK